MSDEQRMTRQAEVRLSRRCSPRRTPRVEPGTCYFDAMQTEPEGSAPAGLTRRSVVRGAAWSVPVVAAAIAVPAANASVNPPFTFMWDSVAPFARLLYNDESPVPAERLGASRAFSTLTIDALETNASDLTIEFVCGAITGGHTNYLGEYAAAVGVWKCGDAPRTMWVEGTREYNALPLTSGFVIPANTLSVGTNLFPLTWRLTTSNISYPGPYGPTKSGLTTTVSYEGAAIFTHAATGYFVDSTEPVQMEMNDIFG